MSVCYLAPSVMHGDQEHVLNVRHVVVTRVSYRITGSIDKNAMTKYHGAKCKRRDLFV